MVSQTVEYALRALSLLASTPGVFLTTQQIAESMEVPLPYLRKIMQQLVKARLLQSQRGKEGGFSLNAHPKEVRILDVIDAIDPITPITRCPLQKSASCEHTLCPMHKMLQNVTLSVQQAFASVFLQDLLSSGDNCSSLESLHILNSHCDTNEVAR